MLLVQETDVLLLDEPMNHLDPLHKLHVLGLLSALVDDGRIVVASLHDPVLASRFARQVLLLFGDGRWEFGPSDEMLTTGRLERLYGTPFAVFSRAEEKILLPTTRPGNLTRGASSL
jgi:iron complex transport system ATP-binding protein